MLSENKYLNSDKSKYDNYRQLVIGQFKFVQFKFRKLNYDSSSIQNQQFKLENSSSYNSNLCQYYKIGIKSLKLYNFCHKLVLRFVVVKV